jgi:hypothetical protein
MNGTQFTVTVVLAVLGCVSLSACVRRMDPPSKREMPTAFSDNGSGGSGDTARARMDGRRKAKMANDEAEMDLVARLFLTGPRGPRDIREMTPSYPWVSAGRVYWVLDRKLNRRLVVVSLGDWAAPVCLSCVENTDAMSGFLSRQFEGKFPGHGRFKGIAEFLKDVKVSPAASIASPEFLDGEKGDGLASWLRGREKERSVFERLCKGVEEHEDEDGWRIGFNVFNQSGGVNAVKASGTLRPFTVRQIDVAETKPAGEFSYPIIGN